jgi:hypothetical protein
MIIRLRFANFGSFPPLSDGALHELSWVAGRANEHPHHLHGSPGFQGRLLPVIGLYGANASGKSHVTDAHHAMCWHVLESFSGLKPDEPLHLRPYKLASDGPAAPTTFDMDFLLDGVRHRYGFSARASHIEQEWLHVWPNKTRQVLFERDAASQDPWYFGPSWRGERRAIARATRANSLFLSTAAAMNHPLARPAYSFFSRWGRRDTEMVGIPMMYSKSPLFEEKRRSLMVDLLRAADVGVIDFKIVNRRQFFLDRALGSNKEHGAEDRSTRSLDTIIEMFNQRGDPHQLHLVHRGRSGESYMLEPEEESDGTVTLIHLLHAAFTCLEYGSPLIVDELDRALHPRLAEKFLDLFSSPESNPHGAQLLFTSHDPGLMRQLRRDEIVLVEKDIEGASSLAAISEFHALQREDIASRYSEGRYGGVPRTTSFVHPMKRYRERARDGAQAAAEGSST